MTALGEDDIEKLFSGAPQYFARSEGHFSGAPHPSVAFPFDEALEIRDLTDHVQIEDKAWGGVTSWPHLTRDINHDAVAKRQVREKHKAHFHVRCRERPNMLSMQGLEKGTMGYQAALELAVSDSLAEEQFGFESIGKKAQAIVDARQRILSSSGWLHRVSEVEILDRLELNGSLYRSNDLQSRPSTETFNSLFHNFMRPCAFIIDKSDRHSLINQINALVKCLGAPNVWVDLSHVEWRIRLGQVLWGQQHGDHVLDSTLIDDDVENQKERAEERYWLLLQIVVATELLIRLDAVTEGEEYGVGMFRPADVAYFERAATPTVKWSLLLARSWLENIRIVKEEAGTHNEGDERRNSASKAHAKHMGWLASLVSKMSLHHHRDPSVRPPSPPHQYTIQGRYAQRQVDGLIHFATKLRWPGINQYRSRILQQCQETLEDGSQAVSISKTLAPASEEASCFEGAWDVTSHHNQRNKRANVQRRKIAAALHSSGWLSKSYVFGLILPGETVSHFLMATLIENDKEAMSKLGHFANLTGGFVYEGKSFWSTSCIVGRVLAAGRGSAECMGWVSTDITPKDFADGWVHIESDEIAEDLRSLGKRARLWGKKALERESSILGDGDEETVSPADFVLPHENAYINPPPNIYVELNSLELLPSASNMSPTPLYELTACSTKDLCKCPEVPSYPATLRFTVSTTARAEESHLLKLTHDINFVTAHPCSPSQRIKLFRSPSSPTLQEIDVSKDDRWGKGSRTALRLGHPLHKYFTYKVIHVSELLRKKHSSLSELLTPERESASESNSTDFSSRVLVVDCITNYAEEPQTPMLERMDSASSPLWERSPSFPAAAKMHMITTKREFGSDLEILVRAVCAQNGWNAVISRKKRGCMACAIREASALGWRVVIRVD